MLLRGSPCSGKTTWIEEKGLRPYTLSADDIRLMYQSPSMDADGSWKISQDNNSSVWKTLLRILKGRMYRGDFTVVDATNSRTSELNRYLELCREYKYRAYCVDFTDVPIEEVKKRNIQREAFRRVPQQVTDTMYARFTTQKVPSGIKVIKPEELDTVWLKLRDLSGYEKIHHIGDIHGCNTVLQKYLSDNGGMKENEMYIFTGDYIDRGVENAETVRFLLSIMDQKNVLLLEGNHERSLWLWANNEPCQDTDFEQVTKQALEHAGISQKDVRNLYRKFGQCAYYEYDGKIFLVTHAGLGTIPENLTLTATEQMLEGAGRFEDAEKVSKAFIRTTPDNCFQIFGHRNVRCTPLSPNGRVFNLEGQVEHGGCLRCLQVGHDGFCAVEVKNDVYKNPQEKENKDLPAEYEVSGLLTALRDNPYIGEKKYGNISSFNYTDEAFRDKVWNSQTVKARGLYLDVAKGKVAARAYDKFFNIEECWETRLDNLQRRMSFPVVAYVKENGFLGMVSYDEYADDLFVACKSTTDSRFAVWLKEMLQKKILPEHLEELKAYVREMDVSFVFECVDMEHDPHIIEYSESRLVLLDIVSNSLDFNKYSYEEMYAVAEKFGLEHKEKAYEFTCWQEFFDWYYALQEGNSEYQGHMVEGFVVEDSNGYMTKVKTAYYRFWKQMCSVSREVRGTGSISNTASLTSAMANEFYGWLRKCYDAGKLRKMPKDICSLRKLFLEERGGLNEELPSEIGYPEEITGQ